MLATLDQIDAAMARGESQNALGIARQASVEGLDADLSSAEDLNNAGVIAELHGDRSKAIALYQRASQTRTSNADARAIEKNLRRVRSAK
jgi:tetratricopeptide (TPR) repeat protein